MILTISETIFLKNYPITLCSLLILATSRSIQIDATQPMLLSNLT